MNDKLTFIVDPGHGWLRVPVTELETLGIVDDISPYSYLSPRAMYAFLEEDGDVGIYLNARKNAGYNQPRYRHVHFDMLPAEHWPGRDRYPLYNAEVVKEKLCR